MRTALMMVLALAVAPLAGAAAAGQTVWKWVDERGVTHYSDRPVPGATRIELSTGNTPAPAYVPPRSSSSDSKPAANGPAYSLLTIARPQAEESIVNTAGIVLVDVSVEPRLSALHRLQLYVNGNQVEGASERSTSFELKEMPRGTHTVRAVIVDNRGNTVQETQSVTFTVRQESIAKPPVGPTLKPPPKKPRTTGNKLPTTQPTYAQVNGQRPAIDLRTNAPVVTKPTVKPSTPKQGS